MKSDDKNKIIIGVTGYVGSGKTLFCEMSEKKYNCMVIYTDEVAKNIINNNDNFIYLRNRKGDILSDIEIENIKNELHPMVWREVKKLVYECDDDIKFFLVETALPTEPFFDLCEKTILIQNSMNIKTQLLKNNRDYNDNIINAILKSQDSYKDYYNKCDYIIDNNATKEDFENKVYNVINKIIM